MHIALREGKNGSLKLLTEHEPESFEARLKHSNRSYLAEVARSVRRHKPEILRSDYAVFLESVHAVAVDSLSLVDPVQLESRGLEFPDSVSRVVDVILDDLRRLGLSVENDLDPNLPTISPTFGVSLGMTYALEEGLKISARIAKNLVKSAGSSGLGFDANTINHSFAHQLRCWLQENTLSAEEEQEALFALEAFSQFARRHFSEFDSQSNPV